MNEIEWTNPSVKKLTENPDPTTIIVEKTRNLILDAMDNGWQGPPFDPLALAQRLGISVIPREDVLDARLVAKLDKPQIEYNPNRSRTRIRFSLAHEIAHTFFPDYQESPHNRSGETLRNDEWQLELLCNIAAAEILMPVEPSFKQEKLEVTMKKVIEVSTKFEVSLEAALLRLSKLTNEPVTIFAASKINNDKNADYRLDYVIKSPTSSLDLKAGTKISSKSVLSECIAIGYTSTGKEKWAPEWPEVDIECVGVLPYPNSIYPRVLGIIRTKKTSQEPLEIRYIIGDATEPRGTGKKIIAQIVNDESLNWGRGFGLELAKKFPGIQSDFHKWVEGGSNLKLGNSHLFHVSDDLSIFQMVAQHGYGPSTKPRIRYRSLSESLIALSKAAREMSASVHMPKIGTGYAGGNWDIISELIEENLIKQGIEVTVYELPGRESSKARKTLTDYVNPLAT
jgi:Zn-dependent peptidase ImmA (M78 family)/O-acetyl-ADP-ribose deacetylase (regulator of RNase III)